MCTIWQRCSPYEARLLSCYAQVPSPARNVGDSKQLHLWNVANLTSSADLVLAGSTPATTLLEPDDEVASVLVQLVQ
jgi:hypothetical protein